MGRKEWAEQISQQMLGDLFLIPNALGEGRKTLLLF